MKAVGVICEYNPFHNGHKALFDGIRRIFPEKRIICFMSGEFVQRGELAVFPAADRAVAATLCGADAVFELPSHICLAPAQIYARRSIELIAEMGICDVLCFGSECGDRDKLIGASKRLYGDGLSERIAGYLKDNPYPAATELAYKELYSDEFFPSTPNDILGVEYVHALEKSGMDFVPIKRSECGNVASASALRKRLYEGADTSAFMPSEASSVFDKAVCEGRMRKAENFERAFLSAILASSEAAADVPSDFAPRIKECARQSRSLKEYYERLSVKHFTSARLRRMSLCTALGISAEEWNEPVRYARLLAMRASAGAVLKSSEVPVLSKSADVALLGDGAKYRFEKEARRALFAYNAQKNTQSLADVYRYSPFVVKE